MPLDYNHYPPNWKTEIRPAILARAENRCEHCKIANGNIVIRGTFEGKDCYQDMDGTIWSDKERVKIGEDYLGEVHPTNSIIRIVLTIAHLDHDTTNNSYDNLKAMCQKCHLNYDKVHHANNSRNTRNEKKKQIPLF